MTRVCVCVRKRLASCESKWDAGEQAGSTIVLSVLFCVYNGKSNTFDIQTFDTNNTNSLWLLFHLSI